MKKKILITVENFRNIFIILFISKLNQQFDVTILTSKKKIPKLFKSSYKIIKIKKNCFEKIIDKVCIYFSNCHGSYKQLYYLKFQLFFETNIVKYILLCIKYFLSKIGILPFTNTLYRIFYSVYPKNYNFLKKFDYFLYDFRINDEHNFSKCIIYKSNNYLNLKRIAWVYSWDNSYIYSSIFNADYFLVWSKELKKIFIDRHKIDNKKVIVNYPIQFQYLKKIKNKKTNVILFSCSYGSSKKNPEDDNKIYVKDDIEMIHHLHKIIKKNKLNLKILVRLYPGTNYKKKTLRDLSNLNNVDIDLESLNFFTKENFSKKEISDHLTKKNLLINNARAVFSFGSTFNIEAAILDKPVFHIEYSVVNRKNRLFEYHNFQKNIEDFVFLKNLKNSNVIKDPNDMKKILFNLNQNTNKDYLRYNQSLKKIFFNNEENLNIFN